MRKSIESLLYSEDVFEIIILNDGSIDYFKDRKNKIINIHQLLR